MRFIFSLVLTSVAVETGLAQSDWRWNNPSSAGDREARSFIRSNTAGTLQPGSKTFLEKIDGTLDTLVLGGVGIPRFSEYALRYERWRSGCTDTLMIPALGESITIFRSRLLGRTRQGRMDGWRYSGIVLKTDGEGGQGSESDLISGESVIEVRRTDGGSINGEQVRAILNDPSVPFVDDLFVLNGDTSRVQVEEIRSVSVRTDQNPFWVTASIGGGGRDLWIGCASFTVSYSQDNNVFTLRYTHSQVWEILKPGISSFHNGPPATHTSDVAAMYGTGLGFGFGATVISAGPSYVWGENEEGNVFASAGFTLDMRHQWRSPVCGIGVHALAIYSNQRPFYGVMLSLVLG